MLNGKILELENQVTKIQNEHMEKTKLELANVESELQYQVSKLEMELREKEALIAKLQQEKETLLNETKELAHAHEEEKERLQADFAARLTSAESVLQESIQKSESGQHTEVKLKVLVTNLKREKEELNKQISQLEKRLAEAESALQVEKKDRETDNRNSDTEKDVELGRLQQEYKQRIEDMELEHSSKVKQLLKTFNLKMTDKEKEFQETYSTIMDKSSQEETRLLRDHKEEVEELHKDLNERDEKIDGLVEDYQMQLQAAEELTKAEVQELQQKVAALEETLEKKESEMEKAIEGHATQRVEARMRLREEEMAGLGAEWAAERQSHLSCDASCDPTAAQLPASEELLQQTQAAILASHGGSAHTDWLKQRVIELTRGIEELKIKHKLELAEAQSLREMKEGQLPQPLLAPTVEHRDLLWGRGGGRRPTGK
ncbi:hypothetical protein LSAT2_027389 [Lamellibrachia satsuma]|nr:hypothetical protein LSAT2_027389 [Lamellibrachia satsuma]